MISAKSARRSTIGPLTPFHCQRCFVYPSRGSMSPILPNMSVRTALHRSTLTPVDQGFGEARLPSAATERRLSAARRCRSPHADGAVVEEIDTIEHSIRVINVVYIVFYAFTAHDRRRIVARVHGSRRLVGMSIETHDDKASSCAASPLPVRAPAVA